MRARKIIHHERRAARPEAQRELRKTLKDFAGLASLCAVDMVMLVAQAEADPKKEDSVALAQLSVKDWQEARLRRRDTRLSVPATQFRPRQARPDR